MSTADSIAREGSTVETTVPLERWLWRSYVRSAIVPLLVIEISFLAIYWVSNLIVHHENVSAVGKLSGDYVQDVARREAQAIGESYGKVSQVTSMFASQTLRALREGRDAPAAEKARYAMSPSGAFYTRRDNGTTASFYSGVRPIGPEQIRKVWSLSTLDPLMVDIRKSNPEIASIYVNTYDSYNRIYPYFDVLRQYPSKMDIPKYNFYYEADGKHDPRRKATWTDAYIDPAGQGWMVSSIAPVWNGDRLEGVVGLDITLDAIIDQLVHLDLPFDAYAMLVDRKGQILALPPKGEQDFGLKEVTAGSYSEAILADTFKPDAFNINSRPNTRQLADAMRRSDEGQVTLNFDGPHLASFTRISGLGWRLVVIAPTKAIYARVDALSARVEMVGFIMLAGLLLFYALFFVLLYRRAQAMSGRVAAPLGIIAGLMQRIGSGDYRQHFGGSRVEELDRLGRQMVKTGDQLGDAYDRIVQQERLVSRALLRQRQLHEEQARFVKVISHEVRTPLSVIDSGAQILDRKADTVVPGDLRARASKLRGAVQRIASLLEKLVASVSLDDHDRAVEPARPAALRPLVADLARAMVDPGRLALQLPEGDLRVADGASLAIALRAVIDNALRYDAGQGTIGVAAARDGVLARIEVTDRGPGIPADELPLVGERFFRGSNAHGTQGAGIGLYLARNTLETIGGTLSLRSGPGGTVVTCTVPLEMAAAAEPSEASQS